MKIEKVIKYRVDGEMFDSLTGARNHVYDLIGAQLDKMWKHCMIGPHDKIIMYDYVVQHRNMLASVLLCDYEEEEED